MIPKSLRLLTLTCIGMLVCALGYKSLDQDKGSPAIPPKGKVVIIASCDTKGWIEPCGCAGGQSGGLSRRATLARELAGDRDSLLVSVGGAAFGTKPYDVEKLRAIVAGEAAMGYAVHNLGLGEILIGVEQVKDAAEGIIFVSSNAHHGEASQSARRWFVVKRGGWRLLVIGVVQPGLTDETKIVDPETAILYAMQSTRGAFDAAIVLAYMDRDALFELAEKLPEVDVIIGGMTTQSIAPQMIGRTLLTAVSNKGKFLARISGESADDEETGLIWSADLHEVTDALSENEVQQANLKAFRERLGEFDFSASETSFVSNRVSAHDEEHQFAGSDACARCHEDDTKIWKDSTHSHAWQTIEEVGAHVDSSCQRCHTIGFGLPGGFVNRGQTMDRIDVGCESCHGPSSAHVTEPQSKTPWQAAESCRSCHDHENSPEFEYDSYWQQILHGTAEATNVAEL